MLHNDEETVEPEYIPETSPNPKMIAIIISILLSLGIVGCLVISFTACTYSVAMTHSDRSQGSTDETTETDTASPNIQPNLNIPIPAK